MSLLQSTTLPRGGKHEPARPRAIFTDADLDELAAMYDDRPCRLCGAAIHVLKNDDPLCPACRRGQPPGPARRLSIEEYPDQLLIDLVAFCDDESDPLGLGDKRESILDTVCHELCARMEPDEEAA